MGLFKRIPSVFSGGQHDEGGVATATNPAKPSSLVEPRIRSTTNGSTSSHAIRDDHEDTSIDLDAVLTGNDSPRDEELNDSIDRHNRSIAKPMPRNKQELFEALQRNYHEVTELIRKVDSHLDREQQRGERVMEVVEKIDSLIPVLHKLPEELNGKAESLNPALIDTVKANAGNGSDDVIAAVDRGAPEHQSRGDAQTDTPHTMDNFRDTTTDLHPRDDPREVPPPDVP